MDPDEESFTLSSFDFNSSFALYSSSDDDDEEEEEEDNDYTNELQLDTRDKDDIDAYIELQLPPLPPPSVPCRVATADNDNRDDKELEFRISFSAVVPFPGFHPSSISSANFVSSKRSFHTCEDARAQSPAAIDLSPQPVVESTLSCIRQRPISNHSNISVFPLAWTRFSPPVSEDYFDDCRRISDINNWEVVHRRKLAPSKLNSAANSSIAKLLVKLRTIIITGFGSMRVSLAQAGIASRPAHKRHQNKRKITFAKPFDRWLALCKPSETQQPMKTNGETRSPSKVMEMKFEAVRKLFGSGVSPMRYGGSKNVRMNKSCPTSIKSSPIHQSGDTSLVHAAIAHCKKSFGQNDDFSI